MHRLLTFLGRAFSSPSSIRAEFVPGALTLSLGLGLGLGLAMGLGSHVDLPFELDFDWGLEKELDRGTVEVVGVRKSFVFPNSGASAAEDYAW
jgi:hypothetical protein